MTDLPDEDRLDESLRHTFNDFHLPPDDQVWAGIEQRIAGLPPPPTPARRPLPLPLLLAALVGLLLGWLLPRPATNLEPEVAKAPARAAGRAIPAPRPAPAAPNLLPEVGKQWTYARSAPTGSQQHPVLSVAWRKNAFARANSAQQLIKGRAIASKLLAVPAVPDSGRVPTTDTQRILAALPEVAAERVSPSDSVPGTVRTLVALERRVLVQLGDSVYASRATLLATLRAEQTELIRLRHHTDSLLLALSGLANPSQPAAATLPSPDTAQRQRPARRWSVSLTATPEQNYLRLQTAPSDTLLQERRNHESGRKGLNAALLAEYQLTNRWSIASGLGYNTYGAELRLSSHRTDVSIVYDTTVTHQVSVSTSTNTVYSVREDSIPQLTPVLNQSGQLIGYDTVYFMRPDTVYTTIVQHDSIRTTQQTITPLINKREITTYKKLRPTYHFVTLPLILRYRLTPGNGRWWADIAGGTQLQLFTGGTQLVTEDGRTYRTERVRPRESLFRTLNVSLLGSLAMNYALTPRFSVSVAPSLRWQVLSVYKPETGLRQQPTATGLQLGMRWKL
ncbi:PorT family protein [Hymenobacter sp. J193]|uniref:PorT family protein n=1 Tax=Hymenobacter sp. J193 TaxID=2898429 RepID=UPI0021506D24|nr:PorT family protein [Hymenobacter sp. J193]MCR5890010.1 PorT family protein [Hymenobacter sp. J193]